MKTAFIAAHLQARETKKGRYLGLCPAHGDRHESLAVSEGKNGCTLLYCWAGCSLNAILSAAGLKLSDLFADSKPISAAERKILERKSASAEVWQHAYITVTREAFDRERLLWLQVNSLGAQLARLSDSDPTVAEITEQFHAACRDFAKAEQESQRLLAWRRPQKAPARSLTPSSEGMADVAA
jgi:hypothetical protein